MSGESLYTSLTQSAGFKGEASLFNNNASQKFLFSENASAAATAQSAQNTKGNLYLLAIRNMLDQGFNSFLNRESTPQGENDDIPGNYFKLFKGQDYTGKTNTGERSLQTNEQHSDFIASTPQYLKPQLQRTQLPSNQLSPEQSGSDKGGFMQTDIKGGLQGKDEPFLPWKRSQRSGTDYQGFDGTRMSRAGIRDQIQRENALKMQESAEEAKKQLNKSTEQAELHESQLMSQKDPKQIVNGKEELYSPWEAALRQIKNRATLQTPEKQERQETPENRALAKENESMGTKPGLAFPQKMQFEHSEEANRNINHFTNENMMQKRNISEKQNEEIRHKLEQPHDQTSTTQGQKTFFELATRTDGVKGMISTIKKENKDISKSVFEQAHAESEESPGIFNKAPLRERSFLSRKSMDYDNPLLKKSENSIRQYFELREKGQGTTPLMSDLLMPQEIQQEIVRQPQLNQGRFDPKKHDNSSGHSTIDAILKRDRDFSGQNEQQGEKDFGEQKRGAQDNVSSLWRDAAIPQKGGENAPRQQTPTHSFLHTEYMKQEISKKLQEDTVRVTTDKKLETITHTTTAAKHANTCIESILKKSQKDIWTGDEMAAKLIAILMKSASNFTYEHSSRVIDLSISLAREMGIDDSRQLKEIEEGAMFHDIGEVELDLKGASPYVHSQLSEFIGTADLKNCSFLHDIGKVKIPDNILYKPSRLTDEEFEIIKQHPVIGEAILKPIPSLQHTLPVVRHHHERWDGKGYPDGISGNNIPLAARIIAITDSFDAMVSDRPYRKGMPIETAIAELRKGAGTQFDPQMVEAFLRVIEKNC